MIEARGIGHFINFFEFFTINIIITLCFDDTFIERACIVPKNDVKLNLLQNYWKNKNGLWYTCDDHKYTLNTNESYYTIQRHCFEIKNY